MSDDAWQVFNIEDIKGHLTSNRPVEYREFLSVPALSCGVYHLEAGSTDMQTPHDEDEVYMVLEGRARLKVGGKTHDVKPGTVMYVKATESHSFFEIDEDMTLLVFFAASRPG